jgi:hypothetical protein
MCDRIQCLVGSVMRVVSDMLCCMHGKLFWSELWLSDCEEDVEMFCNRFRTVSKVQKRPMEGSLWKGSLHCDALVTRLSPLVPARQVTCLQYTEHSIAKWQTMREDQMFGKTKLASRCCQVTVAPLFQGSMVCAGVPPQTVSRDWGALHFLPLQLHCDAEELYGL